MSMKKRLLSLVLCLVMVFSLLPMGSLAVVEPWQKPANNNYKSNQITLMRFNNKRWKVVGTAHTQVNYPASSITVYDGKVTAFSFPNPSYVYDGNGNGEYAIDGNNNVSDVRTGVNEGINEIKAAMQNLKDDGVVITPDTFEQFFPERTYVTNSLTDDNGAYAKPLTNQDIQDLVYGKIRAELYRILITEATGEDIRYVAQRPDKTQDQEYVYSLAEPKFSDDGWTTSDNYKNLFYYDETAHKYFPVVSYRGNVTPISSANGLNSDELEARVESGELLYEHNGKYYTVEPQYGPLYRVATGVALNADLIPKSYDEGLIGYTHTRNYYAVTPYYVVGVDGYMHRMQLATNGDAVGDEGVALFTAEFYYLIGDTSGLDLETTGTKGTSDDYYYGKNGNATRVQVLFNGKGTSIYRRWAPWGGGMWTGAGSGDYGATPDVTVYTKIGDNFLNGYVVYGENGEVIASWHTDFENGVVNDPNLYYQASSGGVGIVKLAYLNEDTNTESAQISRVYTNSSPSVGDVIYSGPLYYCGVGQQGSLDGHKTLAPNGDNYDLTIDSWSTGNFTDKTAEVPSNSSGSGSTEPEDPTVTVTAKQPLDIVLVMDQSGSMATKDMDTGGDFEAAGSTFSVSDMQSATYYYKVGEGENARYYPVQMEQGTLYKASNAPVANWTFGWGNDGISLAVNGAPIYYNVTTNRFVRDENGEMHRIYVLTAGLSLFYGMYPYIYYPDANDAYAGKYKWTNNAYWVVIFSPWSHEKVKKDPTWRTIVDGGHIRYIDKNANILGYGDEDFKNAQLDYSWITLADPMRNVYEASGTGYTKLFYVDDTGRRIYISNTRSLTQDPFKIKDDQQLYTYEATMSRVQALQNAASQFVTKVVENQAADANGLNAVSHRIAVVGFAGNKLPAPSSGTTPVGANGRRDYVNTGLFQGSTFTNYATLDDPLTETASTKYINHHYYTDSAATDAVRYDGESWYHVYNDVTKGSLSGRFYEPTYTNTLLNSGKYANAFFTLDQEGQGQVQASIGAFSAYGGTYTSYGIAMANQILEASGAPRVETVKVSTADSDNTVQMQAKRIVVVFTDGEPGGSGYEDAIANEAIAGAVKSKTVYGADVYTVGLYKGNVSDQINSFMKTLSSEYSATLEKVYSGTDYAASSSFKLDGSATYYYEKDGKFYSVEAKEFGESSLGWWEHHPDGSYSLLNVKGKNAGTGTDYLYKNGTRYYGEDADKTQTYKSANGNDVIYEYRWFDADQSIVEPLTSASDTPSSRRVQFWQIKNQARNADGEQYYMTASDAESLEKVFTTISTSITTAGSSSSSGGNAHDPGQYAYGPEPIYITGDNTIFKDVVSGDFKPTSASTLTITMVGANAVNEGVVSENGSNVTIASGAPLQDGSAVVGDVTYVWTWDNDTQTVTVQGFDYGGNYIGGSNSHALRVNISNLAPTVSSGTLYSNVASKSGVYAYDSETGIGERKAPFNNPSIEMNPKYTVTWMNGETFMEVDRDVASGSVPSYDGPVPEKAEDAQSIYTFAGWKDKDGNVVDLAAQTVTEDVTYYAYFDALAKDTDYIVIWKQGDTELYRETYHPGETPAYDASKGAYTLGSDDYFVGWSKVSSSDTNTDNYYYGQYTVEQMADSSKSVTLYAVTAQKPTIETETFVVGYSTQNKISDGVYDYEVAISEIQHTEGEGADAKTVTYGVPMENGGKFSLNKTRDAATGTFVFTPELSNAADQDGVIDLTPLSKISKAYYYKDANYTDIHEATVVPGSSVYLDDSLQELNPDQVTAEGKPITYDYNAVLEGENLGSGSTTDIEKSTTLQFKFTGKRIDLYCTTEETSGTVRASVMSSDGTTVLKSVTMNNTAIDERFNVPTVSFTMEENGTYILQIRTIGATYKLDGVRVYQTYADDSVYAQEDQNANYINLREKLVNGLKAMIDAYNVAVAAHEEDETNPMPDPLSAVAFFNDDSKTEPKDYITSGPKNEIYLDIDQSVAFQIAGFSTYQTAPKVMVGLSVQNSTPGSVKINGETQDVKAVTDAYYTVNMTKTGTTGYVVIENKGTARIAITNLLISGVSDSEIAYANTQDAQNAIALSVEANSAVEEAVEPKLIVTPKLMSFVQNPEYEAVEVNPTPEPSAEPTYQPSIQEMIRQLLSAFVSNLFKSISRLFGN